MKKKKKFSKVIADVKQKAEKKRYKLAFKQARDEIGGKPFFEARKTFERLEKAQTKLSKEIKFLQQRQNSRLIGQHNYYEFLEKRKLQEQLKKVEVELKIARKVYEREVGHFNFRFSRNSF